MRERGIEHTTVRNARCAASTCPVASVDPKTAPLQPKSPAREKSRPATEVDGITGGLAVQDKAAKDKAVNEKAAKDKATKDKK